MAERRADEREQQRHAAMNFAPPIPPSIDYERRCWKSRHRAANDGAFHRLLSTAQSRKVFLTFCGLFHTQIWLGVEMGGGGGVPHSRVFVRVYVCAIEKSVCECVKSVCMRVCVCREMCKSRPELGPGSSFPSSWTWCWFCFWYQNYLLLNLLSFVFSSLRFWWKKWNIKQRNNNLNEISLQVK